MSRAVALSSLGVEQVQEEKEATGALKENDYPSSFVYKHSCLGRPRLDRDEQRPKCTLTLPYISNLSETIRRVLVPLHIQVAFCPLMTLRQRLVHLKDPVPVDERKGVVYSIVIPCTECPEVYIGQTEWLKEHQHAPKNGDVAAAASALAEHALTAGHGIDLSKAEVLDSHSYTTTRYLLESWHIQRNADRLNRERGTLYTRGLYGIPGLNSVFVL